MKNTFLTVILAASLLLIVTACGDFGNMNVSPNSPSNPNTASFLTGTLRGVGGVVTNMIPALYVQQFGDVTYIDESRYKTVQFDYAGFYTSPLNNLRYLIQLNTDEATKNAAAANGSNANQIAVARIMKGFYYQIMTDRWGDIPYSQSLKGAEGFSPSFDTQQAIYNDLFKEWKEAQAQFDGGKALVGDILLSGNVAKWKKFANSLRAIAALRLSKADPAKGKAEFAAALADGVITSNADNVTFKYLNEAANEHPLYNNYITTNRRDYAVSNTFIDYLVKVKDPRLPAMADKNITGVYRGVPYGVFPPTWKPQDVSLAATSMRQQSSAVNVITYAQVLLAQAEAAQLGWTSGNPKDLYEAAIKASMEQWNAYTADAYKTYISGPEVAFDNNKAIEQIATQRWVALFYQGTEAWTEWRRTGFPKLNPASKLLNGGTDIPRRFAYPAHEATLNKANYEAVVARQGKDDQYTRVWWDK